MLVVIHSNLFYSTQQETLVHSNPEFSLGLKWMFIWLQFGSLPAITDLASDPIVIFTHFREAAAQHTDNPQNICGGIALRAWKFLTETL